MSINEFIARRSMNFQDGQDTYSQNMDKNNSASLLHTMNSKRMSINPDMVQQYTTLVRLQAESERGNPISEKDNPESERKNLESERKNPNSEVESLKSVKPSDSTMVKRM